MEKALKTLGRKMNETYRYSLLSALSVVCVLGLWWAASIWNASLAGPVDTIERFGRLVGHPIMGVPLWMHVWASVRRIFLSFVAACVVGVSLGIAFGIFPTFKRIMWPVFSVIRPIPPLAWIPIVVLWVGIMGDASKDIIIFIGIVMAIVINTQEGIRQTDDLLLKAGKLLGANKWQILTEITLPSSIPAIFAGMKTGLSTGWMSLVAAEMIAAKEGIGFLINQSMKNSSDTALDFIGIILVALCSAVFTLLLTAIERKVCLWSKMRAK